MIRIVRIILVLLLGVLRVSAFACGGGSGAEPTPTHSANHTWRFYAAGFFPKHLPDSYNGQVVLADLKPDTVPAGVQQVWWYDSAAGKYRFWVPGVGGDLTSLGGGHTYNYMVLVNGPCEWIIPLP